MVGFAHSRLAKSNSSFFHVRLYLYVEERPSYHFSMISWDYVVWAATVAGFFGGATLFAEKLVSRTRNDELAELIHLRDDDTWVTRFISAFDALFTAGNFTTSRLLRSIAATAFGIVSLWVLFDPILGLIESRANQSLSLWQAILVGVSINFAADFISLAETRWLLNRFRYVRSLFGHAALLLADIIFTGTVIWLALALAMVMEGVPVLHPAELAFGYTAYSVFFTLLL